MKVRGGVFILNTVRTDNAVSERAFMSGVVALTASTVIVKIIGLAYKIPLISILGAEGMGYFNTAYEIFALLCGVSTSGLPVAVSMLVSAARETGDSAKERGVFRTSFALLLTKGLLFSALLILLAKPLSRMLGNTDAYYAILAISPSLLFSCIAGAIRGYFQGCRVMSPTAISQLVEAVGKLVFGVAFAAIFISGGASVPVAAAFAVLGVSLGSFLSATFLLFRKKFESRGRNERKKRTGGYFLALLRISLPITVSSALIGGTRMVDMALIMRRLTLTGISSARANEIYGSYTTLALPVFLLAPAFIPPITENLIPRLSAAVASGAVAEQRRAVANAVRLTVFIAMPASMGVALYSRQILSLLFSGQTDAINVSAPLLSILGASVLFSCLITTTTSVLQSYGRVMLPIVSLLVGLAVKALSAYLLIGDARFGVLGAPISTLLSNVVVLGLDVLFLRGVIGEKTGIFSQLPKPFFASLLAMVLSFSAYLPLDRITDGGSFSFLVAFAIAIVTYFFLACLMGVVGSEDLKMIFPSKKKK